MKALRRRRTTRAATLALAVMTSWVAGSRPARADDAPAPIVSDGLPASAFKAKPTEAERRERRSDRLTLLGVYTVAAAAVVGGSYLFRDDFFGRSIATTAAGWGGLAIGATLASGLSATRPCQLNDCGDEADAAGIVGGLLGGAAGSIAGYFLTSHAGMSRVYTTAAGMAPFIVIVGAGTIAQW